MSLDQLIEPSVPVLKPDDTGDRAIEVMETNYLHQLPVVNGEDYLAIVREDDLLECLTPETPLAQTELLQFRPFVPVGAHPFDALGELNRSKLSVLPVVDTDHKYLGSITKDTLLQYMADNTGIQNPGSIIILEIHPRNYTLYEIAGICEKEDVMITHASLRTLPDGIMEVTLKLNKNTTNAVVASFERHKYTVKEIYGSDNNDDDLTDNYNLLMAYLNI
jgi:acetoin utilization protein AcuB